MEQVSGSSTKDDVPVPQSLEIPRNTQVVLLLNSSLSPSRQEILAWNPEKASLGGVCRIEKSSNNVFLQALTSGEERELTDDSFREVYEWAREELIAAFDAKIDFLICDLLVQKSFWERV